MLTILIAFFASVERRHASLANPPQPLAPIPVPVQNSTRDRPRDSDDQRLN